MIGMQVEKYTMQELQFCYIICFVKFCGGVAKVEK